MSADNLSHGPARKRWAALTDHQRRQAARLTLSTLAAAAAGQPVGVSLALAEASRVAPSVEEHVVWATGFLAPALRLSVDPDGGVSRYLVEGLALRRRSIADQDTQEGLFS